MDFSSRQPSVSLDVLDVRSVYILGFKRTDQHRSAFWFSALRYTSVSSADVGLYTPSKSMQCAGAPTVCRVVYVRLNVCVYTIGLCVSARLDAA